MPPPSLLTLTSSALGNVVVVASGRIVEEISRPTEIVVSLEVAARIEDLESPLGQPATVELATRRFAAVITALEEQHTDRAAAHYTVTLAHPTTKLRLRSDHRVFVDKSVKDVVTAVLEKVGLTAEWKASRGTSPRPLTVQWAETDLQFVGSLLAEEGISWWCPDDEPTKIAVADGPSAFTPLEGGAEVAYIGATDGIGVQEIAFEHVVTSGAVTLGDYDLEKPGLDLTARVTIDDAPAGEVFEYPGGYTTPADGAALAKVRAEEIASTKIAVTGVSTARRLAAGRTMTLTNEHGGPAAKLLLHRVEHEIGDHSYRNRFVGSPLELPYRPRRVARPAIGGTLSATATGPVGQEIHTDELGRTKLLYAFDRLGKNDPTSSSWVRVLQPAIGGSMKLARVGWELAVRHLDGHPDRPVAMARMYDGEHPPPETLPAAQTKTVFETLSSPRGQKRNRIGIEDRSGNMLLDVRAAKDLDATVLHDELETIGESDILEVGQDETTLIGDKQVVTVDGNETALARKDTGVEVAKNRKKTVGMDETVAIDGSLSTRVDGNDEETVGQSLEIEAKKDFFESTDGAYDLTVGGAFTAKAKKDFVVYVAGSSSETVGGAKTVSSSDGPLVHTVGGNGSITIGAACVETVDGNRITSAEGDIERSVGAVATLTASGKLQIKAKTIKVTVAGAATLAGGGGTLSATPASLALVGAITLKASGGVEIVGGPQLVG